MHKKHLLVLLSCLLLAALASWAPRAPALTDKVFNQWLEQCSEPGADFVSDNWVSNEMAYADHLDFLRRTIPSGSVFIGVGPEQNFSYLAAVPFRYAFIVDIRRGNLLQHLYYKVLFEECPTPQQWLAALCSRRYDPVWQRLAYADWLQALGKAPVDPGQASLFLERFRRRLARLHFAARDSDWKFLARLQSEFASKALDVRFEYRTPKPGEPTFPSFREVLLARDPAGAHGCFLASPSGYARVRLMQQENRIIPVVGDFGGRRTFGEIANILRRHHLKVGLFYASNVEFYLMPRQFPGAKMENFVWNLECLPSTAATLLLRTHKLDLPGAPAYPWGKPLFEPRLQYLQRFVQRYEKGELPDYAQCLLQDDLSRLSATSPAARR